MRQISFVGAKMSVIDSIISPTRDIRHMTMDIISKKNFIEVYIIAPVEVCEQRDV